jgi:hypothetical protein
MTQEFLVACADKALIVGLPTVNNRANNTNQLFISILKISPQIDCPIMGKHVPLNGK